MPSSYSLGEHYETYIKNLVDSGRYASASEVVRAAMREFEVKEGPPLLSDEYIRAAIKDADDDPRPSISAEEVFARLEAKYGTSDGSRKRRKAA